jgi:hypothetical protein
MRATGLYGVLMDTTPATNPKWTWAGVMDRDPRLDGVLLFAQWNKLQPSASTDWVTTTLDQQFHDIIDANLDHGLSRKIAFAVECGSACPTWAASYAAGNALNFIISAKGGAGGHGHEIVCPVPWDATYKANFATMIAKLKAYLTATSYRGVVYYDIVSELRVTGINEDTAETRMPQEPPLGPFPVSYLDGHTDPAGHLTDAQAVWAGTAADSQGHFFTGPNAPYRPSKAKAAWQALAAIIQSAFPDKTLALAPIAKGGFPNIDEVTGAVSSAKETQTTQDNADYFVDTYTSQTMVMSQSLDELDTPSNNPLLVRELGRGSAIGLQFNDVKFGQVGVPGSELDGSVPQNVTNFAQSFANAVTLGASIVEIWPSAWMVPQFSPVLDNAHATFSPTPPSGNRVLLENGASWLLENGAHWLLDVVNVPIRGSRAIELETANPGALAITVHGTQAHETDTAHARHGIAIGGSTVLELDIARPGIAIFPGGSNIPLGCVVERQVVVEIIGEADGVGIPLGVVVESSRPRNLLARAALTQAQILEGDVAVRSDAFILTVIDANGRDAGTLPMVDEENVGTLSFDSTRTTMRTLAGLTMYRTDLTAIDTEHERIRVEMLLQNDDVLPLGTLMFGQDNQLSSSWGATLTPELFDEALLLDQGLPLTVSLRAGSSVQGLVYRLLLPFGITAVFDAPDVETTVPLVFLAGSSCYVALAQCAQLLGCFAPYYDNLRRFRFKSPLLEGDTHLDHVYPVGERIVDDSFKIASTQYKAPNRYIVVGSDPNNPVVGIYDLPDSAPNSAKNRSGRVVTRQRTAQGVTDIAMATHLAWMDAITDRTTYQSVAFDATADPRHDGFDTMLARGTRYLETLWSLQLVSGGAHHHEGNTLWVP